ncbi:MAG: thiamine-phosphate kinase [Hyphomicrobiaceae bacterium]|nr:thiamine-phosphate kinase [Hyphomicrobiaceae bacterium]
MPDKQAAPAGEEQIIAATFAPLAADWPGAFGLQDDCASIAPAPGHELIVKTDPLRAGVHFFVDDHPEDIAWKALAVNVSDLAAKAARPLAYLLAASFPERPEAAWLSRFGQGLAAAQQAFGVVLIGGDTDRAPGPMSFAVTVFGEAPVGRMLRRGRALPGDILYVSGTLGDAALGLELRAGQAGPASGIADEALRQHLLQRYLRPRPRLGLKAALRNFARGAMDLSDGLAKDLGRMCRASGCGAQVDIGHLPVSPAFASAQARADEMLLRQLVGAGDDYEILAAVSPADAANFEASARAGGVEVRRIGHLRHGGEVRFVAPDGNRVTIPSLGYAHF